MDAVQGLLGESVLAEEKAEFLTALARKGETPEEIGAFALALRERAVVPPLDPATRDLGVLDVCGTGGDRLNTFNISTTVAIVAASAGIPVAKHGNRAITSQSGSAWISREPPRKNPSSERNWSSSRASRAITRYGRESASMASASARLRAEP